MYDEQWQTPTGHGNGAMGEPMPQQPGASQPPYPPQQMAQQPYPQQQMAQQPYPQQQMAQQPYPQQPYPMPQPGAQQYPQQPYPQGTQYPQYPQQQYPQQYPPRRKLPTWAIVLIGVLAGGILILVLVLAISGSKGGSQTRDPDPGTGTTTSGTTRDDPTDSPDPSPGTTTGTTPQSDLQALLDSDEVTEMDIQLARQSGAPDDVIASLEAGRWPSDDDKVFIRRTNLAIGYMLSQYGEECEPAGTFYGPSQGFLFSKENTIVLLTISSGPNSGMSVEVHVSIDGDKVLCSDSYEDVQASSGEQQAYDAAIKQAMADIPQNSWTVELNATYGLYFARIFVAPGILNDQAAVDSRLAMIDAECQKAGIPGKNEVIVLPNAPADGTMTQEYVDSTWGKDYQSLMSAGSTI